MGRSDRPPALVKVAYFSPLPPERSGISDYSALLLPALRERIDVAVVERGQKKPPRGTDVCVYHVGNNPDGPRLDRRRASPHARRRRPPRLRAAPPRRRADARAEGRRGLPERDGARGGPAGPAARARRRRRLRAAALVDAAGGLPARGRGARPGARARADRPLGARPRARARDRVRRADLADPDAGLARAAGELPRRSTATR